MHKISCQFVVVLSFLAEGERGQKGRVRDRGRE